ncbi:protein kinase family protein [Acetobacterium sp. KB-1]|uniref:protein kinase family protein n=1 Tax=Acetobacterium sp. KB-1 TaxID=2184575 RepID=UPI0019550EA5|nr:protein kinase family protein [Acetobacterium sp. KB-1]
MRNPYRLTRLSGNRLETLRRTLALDGFVLIKTLGQGRFGSCYLMSRDTKHYVLKIFNPNDVKRRKEKLARESKFLKKIDHPAIPKLNQLLDRDGFYGLVMEKMPGQSLEDLLEWDYIFNKKEITAIMEQLIAVMDYLSGLHITHRDIKTDNLLWTGDLLSLIDFGSASCDPKFRRRFNPDFWGIGDVFLRLASNCDEMSVGASGFSISQLNLDKEQQRVIKRLLCIEKPYQDFQVLKEDFGRVWINKGE